MIRSILQGLIVTTILLATTGICNAAPIVDGWFDPTEGYSSGYYVCLSVEGVGPISDQGQLWLQQDSANNLYASLILPKTLVDNTYGTNAIGWGQDAPSGKEHTFDNLKGSDNAQFRIYDSQGGLVLDLILDYIHSTKSVPSGYASGGVIEGDGDMVFGLESDILEWGTSLDYNFNVLDYVLTKDSPATDSAYTENPQFPGWEFAVVYEFKVDGRVFGCNDFGSMEVPLMHISPNKIGGNKVFGEICQPIPEPITISLLGLGGLALIRRRSRG